MREHRGDIHTSVLSAAGVTGRECNVLHAAAGGIPREYIARSRDYDDEKWRHARNSSPHGGCSVTTDR